VAELGTPRGALEHGQLLTEGQILERHRAVSTADQRERSKRDDERSQHESSCPGTATASTGTGDLILANDSPSLVLPIACGLRLEREFVYDEPWFVRGAPEQAGPGVFCSVESSRRSGHP
jgi:hypothetical protein